MKESILKHFGGSTAVFYHEAPGLSWEAAKKECPRLSKGWFELSKLEKSIRLEFIRDYWINALPYFPHVYAFLDRFFSKVDEIGIISVKKKPYLYYDLRKTCFIGGAPHNDEAISAFKDEYQFPFPEDFLQFFRVHNGFTKGLDTGVFPIESLADEAEKVRSLAHNITSPSEIIKADGLFPFYRSFNLEVYQCFYSYWYVDGQVGNVLCSLKEGTISNFRTRNKGKDYLAFPSFLDWLIFYLEDEI